MKYSTSLKRYWSMRERKEWHLTTCNRVLVHSTSPPDRGSRPPWSSLCMVPLVSSLLGLRLLAPSQSVSNGKTLLFWGLWLSLGSPNMRFTISPSRHFSVNIGLKVLIFVIKIRNPNSDRPNNWPHGLAWWHKATCCSAAHFLGVPLLVGYRNDDTSCLYSQRSEAASTRSFPLLQQGAQQHKGAIYTDSHFSHSPVKWKVLESVFLTHWYTIYLSFKKRGTAVQVTLIILSTH